MANPRQKSPSRIYLSIPDLSGTDLCPDLSGESDPGPRSVGTQVVELEEKFSELVGRPAVGVSSGTAAIHLGLKLLGLRPGDEVVVPTLTFVATANPVLYEGGTPVFIDSERVSWNLDPGRVAEFLEARAAVNRLPKALIVVHLFGLSANLAPLLEVCRRFEVPVLEDAAEALGVRYRDRFVGSFGDVGVFSFNANKIITATGGGMLVSARTEWVEKARHWSNQACDPGVDYLHSEVGYNYRFSSLLAGVANRQLELLPRRIADRRAISFRYRDAFADLPGIQFMPQPDFGSHTNWLSCFLIDEQSFGMSQADLIRFLEAANIQCRPVWKPLHTQKLFRGREIVGGAVAEELNQRGICLPSSSCLSLDEQQFVIDRIREAHQTATAARGAA